jgi:uncharacterized protein YoxC
VPLATSASDIAYIALTVFLIASGLGIGYAFFRLGGTFARLSSFIGGTERELLPVINKTGGTVDRVNHQLDKLDTATDSAVDAVVAADEAVRSVSFAVKKPVQKIVGATAGASHGLATLRAKRNLKSAMASAKEASHRREEDFDDELKQARGQTSAGHVTPVPAPSPPPPAPAPTPAETPEVAVPPSSGPPPSGPPVTGDGPAAA